MPVLSDGKPHRFTLDVVSAEADHAILQNWYLSGNLQVYLDKSSQPTRGTMIRYDVTPFSETRISGSTNGSDIKITTSASREIHIESIIVGGSGFSDHVAFNQELAFKNIQFFSDNATIQVGTVTQIRVDNR